MQRLTKDNPRVVWESEPTTDWHVPPPMPDLLLHTLWAWQHKPGTRIRITAEVIPPQEVER